ncbi:hypothetical protein IMZ48_48150 [Candidatus Bathyarchaeota archaeon]|nr:hypothetical protein [Candidatus Bathyarchaeota archaeon]
MLTHLRWVSVSGGYEKEERVPPGLKGSGGDLWSGRSGLAAAGHRCKSSTHLTKRDNNA